MEKIKYTDLLDYILLVLKIVRDRKPKFFVSLVSLMRVFNYNTSFGEIQEIGKYLETRGWINAIFILGDVRIQLTTSGVIYIEEKHIEIKEKYDKFIIEFRKEKTEEQLLVDVFSEQDTNEAKKPIFELIEKALVKMKEKGIDLDFTKDLEVIKVEVSKNFPDLRLIGIKLNRLASIPFLTTEITELKYYFSTPDSEIFS
ncbi:MAG: hypothetical protein COZ21_05065 [Bacteroidetes bacterium CG_4_10_14_3_um_filter_31_20]|nr:MAG: hypothetical protein COZ59_12025 [Bacteroidetes bacterium CG_4_8_14_3_um_filter_31_14]PIY04990.1 MAG: hypothetical protein COZ21_05065 [Bacteroidetes bacterium CG_4_10_14_3_um_filter_31_20]